MKAWWVASALLGRVPRTPRAWPSAGTRTAGSSTLIGTAPSTGLRGIGPVKDRMTLAPAKPSAEAKTKLLRQRRNGACRPAGSMHKRSAATSSLEAAQ